MPNKAKQTFFSNTWLTDSRFSLWLSKSNDSTKATCKLCKRDFSLSNMGLKAVISHSEGANHIKRVKEKEEIKNFFNKKNLPSLPQEASTVQNDLTPSEESSEKQQSSNSLLQQQTITSSILDSKNLTAEIIWALKCVTSGFSNNSNRDINKTFKAMFPDSNIAKHFQMGANKLQYMVNWGIAPYFRDRLVDDVNKSKYISIGFDESLNTVTQTCQMDLTVRYWDSNRVQVRYWDSSFLGHTTAIDLLEKFNEATESVNHNNVVHVSMDGPSVNHKFYRDLVLYRKNQNLPQLVDIGTCNLHNIHNAFKLGFQNTTWEMKNLLRASYQILHDSPARRDDFVSVTESSLFPLSFCGTRWVEDKIVADRLNDIWPNIVKIIKYWNSLPKSKQPKCKSFETLQKSITDDLIPAKLSFFSYIASLLQPFLKKYQSIKPLIPFMYDDLSKIVKKLLTIILKGEKLKSSVKELKRINLNNKKNLLSYKNFHLGLATESKLRELRNKDIISETDENMFKTMVKVCVTEIVAKLFEKSPLDSVVIRSARVLKPELICSDNKVPLMKMMKLLSTKLHSLAIIDVKCGDKAYDQYGEFIDEHNSIKFNEEEERLDELYFKKLYIEKYQELSEIAMILFTISHGQADVERGFSVNSNVIDVNMSEVSIKSKRLIRDHMIKHDATPSTIEITNQLKKSCRSAYQRYQEHLKEERKKLEEDSEAQAKKILNAEIKELESKIIDLDNSVSYLDKKFVDLVRNAENNTNASVMISEANGLKRKSEEKSAESDKLRGVLNTLKAKRAKK